METATFRKLRFSHLEIRWLVLFTLAHLAHHLLTALAGPLLPFIRADFNLDYAGSGLVLSVFSIVYGLSQLPGGWLADRLGARRLITIGIIGVAAAGVAIYFSRTYLWLLLLSSMMGFLGGGYHPAAPPLVCATAPRERRGLALGVHAVGGSAAFFVAPLVVAVTAGVWGWRTSYLLMAVPALIFGIILYGLLGRFKGEAPAVKATGGAPGLVGISLHRFIPFVALSALGTIAVGIAVAFLPLMLVDEFEISESSAAALLAVVYLTGIFANLGVGFLTDTFSRRGILIFCLFVAAAAAAVFYTAPFPWGILGLLVIFGILIVVLQNVAESFIMCCVTRERASSILGTYYFVTMAGSGLFTPLAGALIDRAGFRTGFGVLAAVLAVAGLAYLFTRRLNRLLRPEGRGSM